MIDFIFTIDYEIYGNGEGTLRPLVHDPAARLMALFRKWNARFVLFVEAAELEKIEEQKSDEYINRVRRQVREAYTDGFEIGLHLHPQWYNARYENHRWQLDYKEYNLCTLPRARIAHIIDRSIRHVRDILGEPGFTPLSFRAGNWLLQPTEAAAAVLIEKGFRIESSVFKGGLQRTLGLDYRPALKNGYYWPFQNDVNTSEPAGSLIEIPTYTVMTPSWTMLTAKRMRLQRKGGGSFGNGMQGMKKLLDYLRFRYPLKLDFCRMTSAQLISTVDKILKEDRETPGDYRPIAAIGHTKDLFDLDAVDHLLSYLRKKEVPVTTFTEAYARCKGTASSTAPD